MKHVSKQREVELIQWSKQIQNKLFPGPFLPKLAKKELKKLVKDLERQDKLNYLDLTEQELVWHITKGNVQRGYLEFKYSGRKLESLKRYRDKMTEILKLNGLD